MKKRLSHFLLVLSFLTVFGAGWNCSRALAQSLPQINIAPAASAHCHQEKASSEDDSCCARCKVQEVARVPSTLNASGILSQPATPLFSIQPVLASRASNAHVFHAFLLGPRSRLNAIRVSTPEAPLFLQVKSLLI